MGQPGVAEAKDSVHWCQAYLIPTLGSLEFHSLWIPTCIRRGVYLEMKRLVAAGVMGLLSPCPGESFAGGPQAVSDRSVQLFLQVP